ncbi:hypothetical protein Cgig2_015610 [Carnegiea gigantea]|uniref:DUF4283 domain-containing protein n=1 Tax=Carnegiea gigantea TaxID=171969 RepID=A0A9Q1GS93_9CARY|nr:hypothetical protein Cgig2_015610 [Carnegiea gigantea]
MACRGRWGRPRQVQPQLSSPVDATPASEDPDAHSPSKLSLESPILVHPESASTPIPQVTTSSYASLVDPEEGTGLKFVSADEINGVKCTKLNQEDIILGANPPFEVIKGFINRVCENLLINKILLLRNGVFLVRFENLQDKEQVVKKGVYFFDNKPFLSIKSLPLWIRLPDLDIKNWGSESLSKICSVLGIPLKTDRYIKDRAMINYARVLVEFPLEGPFPEIVDFFNENNTLIRQSVAYEWLPSKCSHCHMFGHLEEVYRKKGVIQKEWWRVDKPAAPPPTAAASSSDPEGFTPIRRRESSRQPEMSINQHALQQDSRFSILENEIQNVEKVAAVTFPGWRWAHNFSLNNKGRLWLAWNPKEYAMELSSYIYTLKNAEGETVEGFDQISKVMGKFYTNLLGTKTLRKVPWDKIIWAQTVILRHSSTTWILAHGGLPTRVRLNQHIPQSTTLYKLCH